MKHGNSETVILVLVIILLTIGVTVESSITESCVDSGVTRDQCYLLHGIK